MKRITNDLGFLVLALFSLSALGGCAHRTSVSPTSAAPVVISAACVTKPAVANDLFAIDFYDRKENGSGNIFFSPFSISSALAMTAEGTKGQTASEMWSVLKVETDPATRQADYSAVFDVINATGKSYQLSTSNDLWVEQTFPLLPGYLSVLQGVYHAGVTNLDFIDNPDPSRSTINNAVSDQTDGKITDLLAPGFITNATRLVLTNAIYFKATWLNKFPASDTAPGVFNVTATSQVTPSMMHQKLNQAVEDFYGTAKVLELPYVNNEVSMFVFLPNESDTSALEASLTSTNFNAWMAARQTSPAHPVTVDLTLPKFKFSTSYDLGSDLQALGMPTAFSPTTADFSGMATLPPNARLCITKVVHKAFVAVDEDGTEAAGATAVVVGIIAVSTTSLSEVPFVVDHPFIIVIYENSIKTILFMGRVNDPTAS
jgi:serpin B